MHRLLSLATVTAVLFMFAASSHAQTRDGVMGDLLKDISEVESKVVGLAKAMPEAAYGWRPSAGVRSTGEVFAHIASDNYFLPAAMGIAPPADTGINGKDFKTAATFEKRPMTRDQIIAEVTKSFTFLKASMNGMADAQLNSALEVFGQKSTNRGMWITTATHLHEHLGQLIAYARSNKITPPWSK